MKAHGTITADNWRTQGGWTLQRRGTSLAIGARSLPVNRTTARYSPLKSRLRESLRRWRHVLSSSQRGGWNTWASASPWHRWTGRPAFLRGVNAYHAQNLPRLAAGLAPLDDPPANTGPGDPGSIATSVRADGLIDVVLDGTAAWINRDGAALVLSVSQYASRRTTPPRHELATVAAIAGNSTTPPGNDHTFLNPFGPTRWGASTATTALHLTDPGDGPAPGSKAGNDVPPPPPPAPTTCPCWAPPCGELRTDYTLEAQISTPGNSCTPTGISQNNTASPTTQCQWNSGTGVTFPSAVFLNTSATPPRWIAEIIGAGANNLQAEKLTGTTPVGLYQPFGLNDCDVADNTASWKSVRVI